jgi:putative flippase GtrA
MSSAWLRLLADPPTTSVRLSRFLGVGAITTVGYLVLTNAVILLFGAGPRVTSVGVYLLLMPLSFLAHRRVTFVSQGRAASEWVRFCGVHACNLIIAYAISSFAGANGYLPVWLAFLVISIVVPIVNFIAFQVWVFTLRK